MLYLRTTRLIAALVLSRMDPVANLFLGGVKKLDVVILAVDFNALVGRLLPHERHLGGHQRLIGTAHITKIGSSHCAKTIVCFSRAPAFDIQVAVIQLGAPFITNTGVALD